MKRKILIIAVLLQSVTFISFTQSVRTVSNHPLGGAQYNSLQSAYDAAVNGDTLLIEGSTLNYNLTTCGTLWAKALVVIGAGYNTEKQMFQRTRIVATSCFNEFRISASNVKFYGIHFVNVVYIPTSITNSLFENCQFDVHFDYGGNACTGMIFRNCLFNQDNYNNLVLSGGATTSTTVSNCIFDGFIQGYNSQFNTLLVDHCLFLRTGGDVFMGVKNSSITNSIFMNFASLTDVNSTSNSFINNISRLATTYPPVNNSGTGNLSNTNPDFVSYTLGSLYSTSQDYHLQAGSAAIGAGSDTTDIGLHGGTTKFSEKGEPLNAPVMRSMLINNTFIAPNGTLNVQINASKPNDN